MRPTRVRIDFNALRANYRLARRAHGGRALAVIKANAYGHGALACAAALEQEVDGFAVAFLDEARVLREGGIRKPILILEGFFSLEELQQIAALRLWTVIHHREQTRMLEISRIPPRSLNVWMKIDSGMHRVGFAMEAVQEAYGQLMGTGKIGSITLMTHFACGDQPDSDMTAEQIRRFDAATAALPGERSLCNSAGVLLWPDAHRHWARPGVMLYGAQPDGSDTPGLSPVMLFESQVFTVRALRAGESLGYGATYVARSQRRIGLVCAGYADGYPQNAPSGTPVAVNGRVAPLVGRVSMDMLTIDLTDIPSAGLGSTVELWGRKVGVNAIARAAGRIAYELLCNVRRAPVEYCPLPTPGCGN